MIINNVNNVSLIYENGDEVQLPIKYIRLLTISGFEKLISSPSGSSSDIVEMLITNDFNLVINKILNDTKTGFDWDSEYDTKDLDLSILERIEKRPDLIAVRLTNDESKQLIYLNAGEDWKNQSLKKHYTKEKHLVLQCTTTKKLVDILDIE